MINKLGVVVIMLFVACNQVTDTDKNSNDENLNNQATQEFLFKEIGYKSIVKKAPFKFGVLKDKSYLGVAHSTKVGEIFYREYEIEIFYPEHLASNTNMPKFSLLEIEDELGNLDYKLLKFKSADSNSNKSNENLSYMEKGRFSGLVEIISMKNSVTIKEMYFKGIFIGTPKISSNREGTKYRMSESECYTITTEYYIDYYVTSGGYTYFSHSELVNVTQEEVCDSNPSGGSQNGGGGTVTEHDARYDSLDDLEFQYRAQMSEREEEIYDSISVLKRFQYLHSASSAFNSSSEPRFEAECRVPNGQADAYRHAYWNALSGSRIGIDLTRRLTTAHEEKPAPDGYQENLHYKETVMDLFNNSVGLNIAENPEGDIKKSVDIALRTGNLYYLNNLDSNCWATGNSQLVQTDL